MGYICPREWNSWHRYGSRGLPLKILQFFKDLIKNKRKNKSKLKVKWNVTAKQRKKNDWKWNEVAIKFKSKSNCIIKVKIISKLNWNLRAIHGERLLLLNLIALKSASCPFFLAFFPFRHFKTQPNRYSFVLPHHNQGVFYSDTTAAKSTVPDAPGFHVTYPNKPWKMEWQKLC